MEGGDRHKTRRHNTKVRDQGHRARAGDQEKTEEANKHRNKTGGTDK